MASLLETVEYLPTSHPVLVPPTMTSESMHITGQNTIVNVIGKKKGIFKNIHEHNT